MTDDLPSYLQKISGLDKPKTVAIVWVSALGLAWKISPEMGKAFEFGLFVSAVNHAFTWKYLRRPNHSTKAFLKAGALATALSCGVISGQRYLFGIPPGQAGETTEVVTAPCRYLPEPAQDPRWYWVSKPECVAP